MLSPPYVPGAHGNGKVPWIGSSGSAYVDSPRSCGQRTQSHGCDSDTGWHGGGASMSVFSLHASRASRQPPVSPTGQASR
jgi:hypothetical protein